MKIISRRVLSHGVETWIRVRANFSMHPDMDLSTEFGIWIRFQCNSSTGLIWIDNLSVLGQVR
jgi:hypothetical protein